jgi:hypothetical protein
MIRTIKTFTFAEVDFGILASEPLPSLLATVLPLPLQPSSQPPLFQPQISTSSINQPAKNIATQCPRPTRAMKRSAKCKTSILIVRASAKHSPSLQDLQDKLAALEKRNESLESRVRMLEVRLATSEDTLINLSPATLGKNTHKSFAFFPKLPPELRRLVWKFARPAPQVLKIFETRVGNEDILYSTAKIPALLHTCQESRRATKEWYELSLMRYKTKSNLGRIYFDFSCDFVYVTYKDDEDRTVVNPNDIDCRVADKVKNVAYEVPASSAEFEIISIAFPTANRAMLIGEREGMSQGGAEQSDFYKVADELPWQMGRTLYEIYNDVVQSREKPYVCEGWDLTSIQRARFSDARRQG